MFDVAHPSCVLELHATFMHSDTVFLWKMFLQCDLGIVETWCGLFAEVLWSCCTMNNVRVKRGQQTSQQELILLTLWQSVQYARCESSPILTWMPCIRSKWSTISRLLPRWTSQLSQIVIVRMKEAVNFFYGWYGGRLVTGIVFVPSLTKNLEIHPTCCGHHGSWCCDQRIRFLWVLFS